MSNARSGFVLPLVALTIAILAVSAFALLEAGGGVGARLKQVQATADFERAAASVEARVAFLLMTEPLSATGIRVGGDPTLPPEAPADRESPTIGLDNRPYTVAVDGLSYDLRLQDEAGLLNLNAENTARLGRILVQIGLAPTDARRLADTLADYVDADDARRAQGAERSEYAVEVPPPNSPLRAVRAAEGALGWAQSLTSAQWRTLDQLTRTAAPDSAFNPNTAAPETLMAAFAIDEKRARDLVRLRNGRPIATTDDLAALLGGGLQTDGVNVTAAPARTIRLNVRSSSHPAFAGLVYEASLVLAEPGGTPPIVNGRRVVLVDRDGQGGDDQSEPLPGIGAVLAR